MKTGLRNVGCFPHSGRLTLYGDQTFSITRITYMFKENGLPNEVLLTYLELETYGRHS
jgi:hypothetical protein